VPRAVSRGCVTGTGCSMWQVRRSPLPPALANLSWLRLCEKSTELLDWYSRQNKRDNYAHAGLQSQKDTPQPRKDTSLSLFLVHQVPTAKQLKNNLHTKWMSKEDWGQTRVPAVGQRAPLPPYSSRGIHTYKTYY
jgi:hypothetical protein